MIFFGRRDGGRDPAFDFQLEQLSALVADFERVRDGASPAMLVNSEAPLLDKWSLALRPTPCLAGLSTGHPTLHGDNRQIATSAVWLMSGDYTWARTLSRWYRLGRPADHFGDHA